MKVRFCFGMFENNESTSPATHYSESVCLLSLAQLADRRGVAVRSSDTIQVGCSSACPTIPSFVGGILCFKMTSEIGL